MLRVASFREQAKGWWFNRELTTLKPEPDTGFVFVPADAISVDPMEPSRSYVQRGRRLYNPATQSYKFTQEIKVQIIRNVPFGELPPSAAAFIGLTAVLAFQKTFDADSNKTKLLMNDLRDAYVTMNSEHIRAQDVNLLYRHSAQITYNEIGLTRR
jgi:hypothetical protein